MLLKYPISKLASAKLHVFQLVQKLNIFQHLLLQLVPKYSTIWLDCFMDFDGSLIGGNEVTSSISFLSYELLIQKLALMLQSSSLRICTHYSDGVEHGPFQIEKSMAFPEAQALTIDSTGTGDHQIFFIKFLMSSSVTCRRTVSIPSSMLAIFHFLPLIT